MKPVTPAAKRKKAAATGSAASERARALVRRGAYDRALPLLTTAAGRAEREHGADSPEAAVAWNAVGVACKFAGRLDEAAEAYARAVPVAEALASSDPDLLATLLHNLAGLEHARGRYAQAETIARRGLALREETGSGLDIAADRAALAAILEGLEQWDDAEAAYREALAVWERAGDDYEVAMTLNGLAAVVRFAGRPVEAEVLFRRALGLLESHRGPAHPDTATVRNNLAMLLNATGRAADALPLLDRAARDLTSSLGATHPATIDVLANRDRVLRGGATRDSRE